MNLENLVVTPCYHWGGLENFARDLFYHPAPGDSSVPGARKPIAVENVSLGTAGRDLYL